MKKNKIILSFASLILLTGCISFNKDKGYTVTWYYTTTNGVLTLLETDKNVKRGTMSSYDGREPTREDKDYTRYIFTGWTPELAPVTKDIEYHAVFKSEEIKYTISWKNYDESLFYSEEVRKGTVPSYTGTTPTREKDAAYTYTFSGWSTVNGGQAIPNLYPANGDITYYAAYTNELNMYHVRFVNYDDELLQDIEISYGGFPRYTEADPVRPGNDYVSTFPFIGWDKELDYVSGDTTYKAVFDLFENPASMFNLALEDGEYAITGFKYLELKDTCLKISVPSEYEGIPITSIREGAFSQSKNLETVILSDSIKKIGNSAFSHCTALKNLTIGEGVEEIGNSAFAYCSKLSKVVFPKSIKSLGSYIFDSSPVYDLTTPFVGPDIDTPQGTDYLGILNHKINNLVLLDGCKKIAKSLVRNSNATLYLPKTIEEIGGYLTCKKLYYEGDLEDYLKIKFTYYSDDYNLYLDNALLETLIVSSQIDEIPDYSLSGVSSLKKVSISSTVTSIGKYAFANCSNLTEAVIGNSVTSIGKSAFYHSGLTKAKVSNSVTTIEYQAFDTSKGCSIYYDGDVSDYLAIDFTGPLIVSNISGTRLFMADPLGTETYESSNYSLLTDMVIPNGIKTIKQYQFYNFSQLKTVTFNDDLEKIEKYAFSGAAGIETIALPDSVTEIGEKAFNRCSSVRTFTANSVTSLTEQFIDCTVLTHINASSLEEIDFTNWQKNYYLKDINIDNSETLSSNDGIVYSKDGTKLLYCPGAYYGDVHIPEGVTEIGDEAFYKCIQIGTITLPSTLKKIGNRAFYGCKYLSSLTIPDGVEEIGSEVLRGTKLSSLTVPFIGHSRSDLRKLSYFFVNDGFARKVILTDACTDLARGTFDVNEVNEIYIPNTITSFPQQLFSECDELVKITIPFVGYTRYDYQFLAFMFGAESPDNYGYIPASLKEVYVTGGETLADKAFYGAKSVEVISIPNSTESIGANAFTGCKALKTLSVPFIGSSQTENEFVGYLFGASSVTYNSSYVPTALETINIGADVSIGNGCFKDVRTIKHINLSDKVTRIEEQAFYYTTGLEEIVIPDSVTYLGKNSFNSCVGLTSVVIGNSIPKLNSGVFNNCTHLVDVTIGEGVTEMATDAFGSRKYFQNLYFNADGYETYSSNPWSPLYGAEALKKIVFGENVTKISSSFARKCPVLEEVVLPYNLVTIGASAFYDCSLLATIKYDNTVSAWAYVSEGNYWHGNCSATKVICLRTSSDSEVDFKN